MAEEYAKAEYERALKIQEEDRRKEAEALAEKAKAK